ncbi:MAG: phosphate regulon transcriptional regulator PhoB [Rhodospirillaceae bacterium]|nr:phosphate regulon transcriptional regulator PhoB [Rhodospirillaceae bacterium]
MKPTVMIVEDEASLMTMLRYNLEKEGFRVTEAGDGEEALTVADETPPDAILLDWMLPRMSGIEVCRQLRRKPQTRGVPIIMLTARGDEVDKVRGLTVGADDYITKPFSMPELLARVRALLRRAKPSQAKGTLAFADVIMDLDTHRVSRDGKNIHLGPTEFRLLQFFMERPGTVFSREELLNGVWGPDIYVEPRTVDVHIRRLRKALNDGGVADIIRTVRAAGYSIDMPDGEISAAS